MNANVGLIFQGKALRAGTVPAWLLLGVGVYVFLLVIGSGLLGDSDTYWQIATGQWILDHATLPLVDIYSFTRAGEPWISSSWLAQVLYAASYQSGRLDRTDRTSGKHDRRNVRASYLYSRSSNSFDLCDPDRTGGDGTFRGAFLCASPRVGAAGHGGVGERTDGGKRAARSTVMVVAAADLALGKPARRICLWPRLGRSIRA